MKYPDTKWCTQCEAPFNDLERLAVDVSSYYNLNEELAWVCSQKCEQLLILKREEAYEVLG